MEQIMTFTVTVVLIGFLVSFYFTMILPFQVRKEVYSIRNYSIDYENLLDCIERASNTYQVKLCCEAVYSFHKRNKENETVEDDVNYLIHLIDVKYYSIKNKLKKHLN